MIRWRLGTDPTWRELERLQRSMDDLFNAVTSTRRPSLDQFVARCATLSAPKSEGFGPVVCCYCGDSGNEDRRSRN